MENQENIKSEKILFAIKTLRDVTAFVKVVPFVYAALFLLCMLVYMFSDNDIMSLLDILFYVSPVTCLTFFRLSFILKFCNWYRLQCCLPMLTTPFTLFDMYICEFVHIGAYINYFTTTLIFTLSLLNTYHVFIKK